MSVGCLSFLLRFFLSGGPVSLSPLSLYLFRYLPLSPMRFFLYPGFSLYVFMSLLPSPFSLSLGRIIHPSTVLSTLLTCKEHRHPQPPPSQGTAPPCGPSPCPGAVLSLSPSFLPPHCPSAPPHPRCLHFSKLHPSPRVPLLASNSSPPLPVNTAFARFSFRRIFWPLGIGL